MDKYEAIKGKGRNEIRFLAYNMGSDLIVCIYNINAHAGAVALSEYDNKEKRASTSVITRLGHKDETIAQRAAYLISKHTKRASCVIAGVHLDNITSQEINDILANVNIALKEFIKSISPRRDGSHSTI
ncbi:hypothetical protein ACFLTP_00765 [Chloroflexota bacterium]